MKLTNPFARPRTSAALRSEIEALSADCDKHQSRLKSLNEERAAVLLSDDDDRAEKHDAETAKAARAVERLVLKLQNLTLDLLAAEAGERQAARRAKYDAAIAKAEDAARTLRKEFPKIGRAKRAMLRQLAEAEIAVAAANAELPEGAEPLPGAEDSVRAFLGFSREILSQKKVELWCFPGSWQPIDDTLQDQVKLKVPHAPVAGFRRVEQGNMPSDPQRAPTFVVKLPSGDEIECVKQKLLRTEFLEAAGPKRPMLLTQQAAWPGLTVDDKPFWEVPNHADNPAMVLAWLDETEATAGQSTPRTRREPSVSYSLYDN